MKINQIDEIEEVEVSWEDAQGMMMKVLIGPDDGSANIIMRHFTLLPGGYSPKHTHNYEHLVKVERGKGLVINKEGKKTEVFERNSIFVQANEIHQFQNPFEENFEFICVIPNPDKLSTNKI